MTLPLNHLPYLLLLEHFFRIEILRNFLCNMSFAIFPMALSILWAQIKLNLWRLLFILTLLYTYTLSIMRYSNSARFGKIPLIFTKWEFIQLKVRKFQNYYIAQTMNEKLWKVLPLTVSEYLIGRTNWMN